MSQLATKSGSAATKVAPILELRAYLRGFAQRCRAARWLGALFHVQIVEDIAGDIAKNQATIAAKAHAAEVADNEADRLIDEVLADGLVESHELPKLRAARAHIRRSAAADRAVGQLARASV